MHKRMVQRPVYFVSSLLQGARSRYSGVQKLLFGLLMASRKLRHYFQAHEITVVTRFPLKRILQNPEATGRIVEWALELSSFGLKFESTSTIQSRALAEFIAEWTPTPDEEIPETSIPVKEASKEWLMYFDGAFSLQGAGAGVLLVAPTGEHLKYVVQMHFPKEQATNNTTEYEGLLAGLRIARMKVDDRCTCLSRFDACGCNFRWCDRQVGRHRRSVNAARRRTGDDNGFWH